MLERLRAGRENRYSRDAEFELFQETAEGQGCAAVQGVVRDCFSPRTHHQSSVSFWRAHTWQRLICDILNYLFLAESAAYRCPGGAAGGGKVGKASTVWALVVLGQCGASQQFLGMWNLWDWGTEPELFLHCAGGFLPRTTRSTICAFFDAVVCTGLLLITFLSMLPQPSIIGCDRTKRPRAERVYDADRASTCISGRGKSSQNKKKRKALVVVSSAFAFCPSLATGSHQGMWSGSGLREVVRPHRKQTHAPGQWLLTRGRETVILISDSYLKPIIDLQCVSLR